MFSAPSTSQHPGIHQKALNIREQLRDFQEGTLGFLYPQNNLAAAGINFQSGMQVLIKKHLETPLYSLYYPRGNLSAAFLTSRLGLFLSLAEESFL